MDKHSLQTALYEISISIGNSFDLDKMLSEAATAIINRLNCTSLSIYEQKFEKTRLIFAASATSHRRDSDQVYLPELIEMLREHGGSHVENSLENRFFYLFELIGFGYLLLTKEHEPFDSQLLTAIPRVNLKLVNAVKACLDHQHLQ